MKKTLFYLLTLALATSAYAAPVVSLEKPIAELTRKECKAIINIIGKSVRETESKERLAAAIFSQAHDPSRLDKSITVARLFARIVDTLELRKKLSSNEDYLSLIKIREGTCFINMKNKPFMLKGKPGRAAMARHYKTESRTIDALAKLCLENTEKASITEFKTTAPITVIHVPGEYLGFYNERFPSNELLETLVFDESHDCIRPKFYVCHDNNTVETQRNSLMFGRGAALINGKICDDPNTRAYLISGTDNVPEGMLPNTPSIIANIDAVTCVKEAIKSEIKAIDIKQLLLSDDVNDFFVSETVSKVAAGARSLDFLSGNLAALLLSEKPLPAAISGFGKALDLPKLKSFAQQCNADQKRYAFVKALFEPLIEETPQADTLFITLPNLNNPLERSTVLLSYLLLEIKQLQEMAAGTPEVQPIVEEQIRNLESAVQEQTQTIETCLREEEEQKVRVKVQERSAHLQKEKVKPVKKPKKKDLIIASNTKPSEVSEEEEHVEKMRSVIDSVVKKKLKSIVDTCKNKPSAIVRKLGEFCEHFGVAMGLDRGKGSHAKLLFGDNVGSVPLPMHDELKPGTANALVEQLTTAISKRIGLQNSTLDALGNRSVVKELRGTRAP